MNRCFQAGALYFLAVFALGFVFGTVRVLVVEPMVGDLIGVLIEVPILLALAWVICARIMANRQVPRALGARLIVAASAFLMLIASELALSLWLFGNSLDGHLEHFGTPHGAVGLVGQVMFAFFPVLQRPKSPRKS